MKINPLPFLLILGVWLVFGSKPAGYTILVLVALNAIDQAFFTKK